MGQGFHRRHSYSESFAALGYSLGPFFLARLLSAIPSINSWIPYTIGILLAVSALYKGIPRVMKPDPSSALGLYIMTSLGLIVITALAHFLLLQVLDQNILHKGFTF
jgi:ABC-type Na+ efflux pump permease subunit